jgi:hypothetical protein
MSANSGWANASRSLQVDGQTITLESQTLRLRRPFGGLEWSRPSAVLASSPSGEVRLPIRDITRRWQIAAYGLSLIFLAAGLIAGRFYTKE